MHGFFQRACNIVAAGLDFSQHFLNVLVNRLDLAGNACTVLHELVIKNAHHGELVIHQLFNMLHVAANDFLNFLYLMDAGVFEALELVPMLADTIHHGIQITLGAILGAAQKLNLFADSLIEAADADFGGTGLARDQHKLTTQWLSDGLDICGTLQVGGNHPDQSNR